MSGLFADLILLLHFAFVLFVVLGMAVIWLGYFCHWSFVRNFWFRLSHLLAMGIVVAESFMGVMCPLTVWEDQLRQQAGGNFIYQGSFIAYWLHRVMFYDASPMTFTVIYTLFFGAVLLSFWFVVPQGPGILIKIMKNVPLKLGPGHLKKTTRNFLRRKKRKFPSSKQEY